MSKIKLPGLIDIHVHLRDPGQTHKEDFFTGTAAAIAGGFTTVFDMPNNPNPIISKDRLEDKIKIAAEKTVSNIGFYFGSLGDNLEEFEKVKHLAWGLKLYLNITTGGFIIDEKHLTRIYSAWSSLQPILLHSEEEMIQAVLSAIRKTGKRSHFCHVSSANELQQIMTAKEERLPVTCGVCPHHLFLSEDDVKQLGPYGNMKPPLKSKKDIEFLWKHIRYVDCIESDHAPHTNEEKDSDKPPFGVPGLESTLPLLLTASHEGRINIDDIIRLCYEGPRKILTIKDDASTYIEVDDDVQYELKNENLFTKCKWTPFDGWKMSGKVQRVVMKNKTVFENDKLLVSPGQGQVITP